MYSIKVDSDLEKNDFGLVNTIDKGKKKKSMKIKIEDF